MQPGLNLLSLLSSQLFMIRPDFKHSPTEIQDDPLQNTVIWMNRFQILRDRTYRELTNNENLLGLRDPCFLRHSKKGNLYLLMFQQNKKA